MSFENHNSAQIDYDYRKRDLATKYSFAISRLGTCKEDEKSRWQAELEKISRSQLELAQEYAQAT